MCQDDAFSAHSFWHGGDPQFVPNKTFTVIVIVDVNDNRAIAIGVVSVESAGVVPIVACLFEHSYCSDVVEVPQFIGVLVLNDERHLSVHGIPGTFSDFYR